MNLVESREQVDMKVRDIFTIHQRELVDNIQTPSVRLVSHSTCAHSWPHIQRRLLG